MHSISYFFITFYRRFVLWCDATILRYTTVNEEAFTLSEWEPFTPGYIIKSDTNEDKRLLLHRKDSVMIMVLRNTKGTVTQKHTHTERDIMVQVAVGKVLDLQTNTITSTSETYHIKSGKVYELYFLEDTTLQATLTLTNGKSI